MRHGDDHDDHHRVYVLHGRLYLSGRVAHSVRIRPENVVVQKQLRCDDTVHDDMDETRRDYLDVFLRETCHKWSREAYLTDVW